MKMTIGNAVTKVEGATQFELKAVQNALAYSEKKFFGGTWKHTTRSMFDGRSKTFLTGLSVKVFQYLKRRGVPFSAADTRQPYHSFSEVAQLEGIAFGRGIYDYQMAAARAALEKRRGVLKMATGCGKTEVSCAISKTLNYPALFLTHRVNLMYQAAERYAKRWPELRTYKRIGVIGDSQYSPNFMTFSTVQTLDRYLKKKMSRREVAEDLLKYRVLFIDEAHRVGAAQFQKVARHMINADYRIGLSATPFAMSEYENNCLLGTTGGIIYDISASELIKRGVLAKPFFKFIPVNEPYMGKLKHWLDVYEVGIVKNQARNEMVVKATEQLVKMDKNPLIIVHHIEHMEILERMLGAAGIKIQAASGNMGARERAKVLRRLGGGTIDAIVCTNIFDEGIDVKEVGGAVLAAGNKSAPAFMQRTGRAIRKKEDDNRAIVIDFMDHQHRMLKKHSDQRLEFVRKEPEFVLLDRE